ncbi:CoA pyrophosphatase [Arenibacter sp. GZD96]|uniref:NUDIX hydrolase n=1 Tax=Aurantibrevibacter litoralis TaxID=3106030 RepID=UPI002AFF92B6|nr:CoA pyrophosphatase [Arenibacter sp. GZD-96]MEA1784956.1 CoA pyrophosphatase [Arenibacter sp. GZD-96]
MNFDDFYALSSKIKNLPLPGTTAHYKMVPPIRMAEMEKALQKGVTPKKAGVMALFYPKEDRQTYLLLMLRKAYNGVHSNQISFPGGKVEPGDIDLLATALRETQEEVGVPQRGVHVVRSLSQVYIPPSNFSVQPYLGLYKKTVPFRIQKEEVAALVEVSLIDFLDDGKVIKQNLSTSYASNISVPAFHFNGYIVWGATAMMLSEVKELLKQVL